MMKQASTKDSALTAGLTSATPTVGAKKPRKKKPNGREKECLLCLAANKDLRIAWREIEDLKAEITGLRNTLTLYREHLGAKEL